MLLEFTCSNHRSIREPILFSLRAGKDDSLPQNLVKMGTFDALKAAVIYGANGSGKSTFIDAISFVKNLVMNSITHQLGQGVRQLPHKLEGVDKDSTYAMQFITKGVRYAFGFTLRNMLIVEEYLYYFPNGRQTKLYEREGDSFTAGARLKSKLTTCKDVLKPNRLLLSCAANFSNVEEIGNAFSFFVNELVIYSPTNAENWMNYSLHQLGQDTPMKSAVLTFIRALGLGVKDISVKINQRDFHMDELPPFLSDEYKSILLQNKVDDISAKVIYDAFQTDLMAEESDGVKKLFAFLCPFLDIVANGKVLVCDELEVSLHEALLYKLLQCFSQLEGSTSQLIFTTHDTSILNLDIFRRDQVWFTELRQDDRSTNLISLAEIKNVRKDENYGKCYMAGRYGAIPMLNVDFSSIVSRL